MSPTNPVQKVNSTGLLQSGSYASDLENEYVDPPGSPEIWSEVLQSQSILFDQWYSMIILVPEISRKVKILAWNGFAQFSPQLYNIYNDIKKIRRELQMFARVTWGKIRPKERVIDEMGPPPQIPSKWIDPHEFPKPFCCSEGGTIIFSLLVSHQNGSQHFPTSFNLLTVGCF